MLIENAFIAAYHTIQVVQSEVDLENGIRPLPPVPHLLPVLVLVTLGYLLLHPQEIFQEVVVQFLAVFLRVVTVSLDCVVNVQGNEISRSTGLEKAKCIALLWERNIFI